MKRQREDEHHTDQRSTKRQRGPPPREILAEIQAELQSIEEKCASEQIAKQQEYMILCYIAF